MNVILFSMVEYRAEMPRGDIFFIPLRNRTGRYTADGSHRSHTA